MKDKSRICSVLLVLAAMGLLVASLALLFLPGFLGYERVKGAVDSLSYSGGVEFFTPVYYQHLTTRCRLAGAVVALLFVLLLLFWRRVAAGCGNYIMHFPDDARKAMSVLTDGEGPRWEWLLLAAVLLMALGLRLFYINQPMRADEARTFTAYVSRPLPILLSDWTAPNNHIFHSLLVRFSWRLFGNHEWALRLPSLLAGILILPLTYLLGRIWFGWRTGLLSISLLAGLSALIEFTCMARGYTMIIAFFLIMVLAAWVLRCDYHNRAAWLMWVVSATLGAYTIPIMLYPAAGVALWMLWTYIIGDYQQKMKISEFVRPLAWASLIVVVWLGILYLPVLLGTDISLITDEKTVFERRTWAGFTKELFVGARGIQHLYLRDIPGALLILLVGGFITGLFIERRGSSARISIFWCAVFTATLLLVIPRTVPYPRVWFYMVPLATILTALGIDTWIGMVERHGTHRGNVMSVMSAFLLLFVLSYSTVTAHAQGYFRGGDSFTSAEDVTHYLQEEAAPSDRVIALCPAPAPLIYYCNRLGVRNRVWDLLEYQPPLDDRTKGRIFIVVNEERHQTVTDLLVRMGIDDRKYSMGSKQQFPGASIYEVDFYHIGTGDDQ